MTLKDSLRMMLTLVSCLLCTGCAIINNFGPYKGKVVDADTGEPIEGAVVFMEIDTQYGTLGGATSVYADAKEVLTDEKGEFLMLLTGITFRPGHLWDYYPFLTIFKPGYGIYPRHKKSAIDIHVKDCSACFPTNRDVTVTLPKLKTRDEMVDNLCHLPSTYNVPFEKRKNLLHLEDLERAKLGYKPSGNTN